jgi:parallel beta-helix repeat protein
MQLEWTRWYSVGVRGQAQPQLESNTCENNQQNGIRYFDFAAGHARQNTCSGNRQYGIYVASTAKPVLYANNCYENLSKNIFNEA